MTGGEKHCCLLVIDPEEVCMMKGKFHIRNLQFALRTLRVGELRSQASINDTLNNIHVKIAKQKCNGKSS